ncbi:hypothetical protein Tco_0335763 [Tanacetum coccineum]
MSCGALYTADFCCSKGGLEDKILVPKPPQNCATCGDPVDGLYCRSCAFVRKCLNEEKETAELEAKCKIQECLNIEEKSIPQASTRSRKFRIDPTLSNFTISTKRIPLSDFEIPPVLLKDCRQKEIYYAQNDVEDLIESAFNSKLLSIKSKSQCLVQEKQEVKNIAEPAAKLIKSSVENLVPIPSESEVTSDNESECDMPVCDDFTTFSNPLFDSNDDFTSSDDESLSDEDVPMKNFKIYSNPLFDDEEIISTKIDPHYFNAESNLIESLLNRDTLIDSSPKIDYLLEEFSGELTHINLIPSGIEKADFDLEEEIRLVENLLYDNSSPRPPEELNLEIANTIFKSLPPSPILVEDSDSLMEEIDLFLTSDDSMPPGIESDDHDSEGDIRFLEELLSNDSSPLPENESFSLDHFDDPSLLRPPPEPPDVEICFDFELDTAVKNDFDELNKDEYFYPGGGEINIFQNVKDVDSFTFVIRTFLPFLTYPVDSPLLLSTGSEDTIFDPGIST